MANIKIGEPIDLIFANRYYDFQRQQAIRDVFDALVELTTNPDDSYGRLYKKQVRAENGGPMLIDILKQKKGATSLVIVRDRAEGMTLEEMRLKFGNVGTRRSEEGDRGFMSRGAKDCTALGKLMIESIKDEKYYKCELTTKPQFVPLVNNRRVNKDIRKELNVEKGNGTVVTLEILPQHRIPRVDSIINLLPRHYALRDILSEHSATKCLVRNLNNLKLKPQKIFYMQPEAELVCEEEFQVRGYEDATAKLILWKAAEPFDDGSDRRFRRSGFLIKGERAIHECSLLYQGFEKDPYAMKYFGRIECNYIDRLLNEYDKNREYNKPHPPENPMLLIDPNRRDGLKREHPFTKALFKIPAERLKKLIDEEKEQEKTKQKELIGKETQKKLDDLAKAASKFLSEQVEDLEELTAGDDVDDDFFSKKGVLIYPTYPRVAVGEIRPLTFYVNRALFDNEGQEISVKSDSKALTLLETPFKLRAHRKKNDRLLGTFRIRGESVKASVYIEASCPGIPVAEAIVEVIKDRLDDHVFNSPLEFEHKTYQIKEGSTKTLRLFAMCPELVNQETFINVNSSDAISVPIRGGCTLVPIIGTNYALGEVNIQGRRLKRGTVKIAASINGDEAICKVKIIQKEEKGVPIDIKIRDEDFGAYRAMWNNHGGKPNQLLISARHDSIKRYLKYNPETKMYDETPYFRVLVAEIVTEAVCRKSLLLETEDRPWEFKWADLRGDDMIAEDVFTQLQKRIRDFAATAHNIMLSVSEIKQ